jgi:hypothetical protein
MVEEEADDEEDADDKDGMESVGAVVGLGQRFGEPPLDDDDDDIVVVLAVEVLNTDVVEVATDRFNIDDDTTSGDPGGESTPTNHGVTSTPMPTPACTARSSSPSANVNAVATSAKLSLVSIGSDVAVTVVIVLLLSLLLIPDPRRLPLKFVVLLLVEIVEGVDDKAVAMLPVVVVVDDVPIAAVVVDDGGGSGEGDKGKGDDNGVGAPLTTKVDDDGGTVAAIYTYTYMQPSSMRMTLRYQSTSELKQCNPTSVINSIICNNKRLCGR